MSEPNHLERMSDVLHALASYQGRVEYANQLAGKVGCSEEQIETYVTALRDAGYVSGRLLRPGGTLSARKDMKAGVSLTMSGYAHVDQRKKYLHVMSSPGKTLGEDT